MSEFHLVAGGEELFMENGLLASPKNNRGSGSPQSAHSTPVRDPSSLSPTPNASTSELPNTVPVSMSMPHLSGPSGWPGPSGVPLLEQTYDALPPGAYNQLPNGGAMSPHRMRSSSVKLEPLMMHAGLFTLPTSSSGGGGQLLDNSHAGSSSHHPVPHISTRLYDFNLWAEGMSPLMVDIDRMTAALAPAVHAEQSSILLRVKLTVPAFDEYINFTTFQGFHSSITLSERWMSEAKCITKSYAAGSTVLNQEVGHLDSASEPQAVSSNDFTLHPVSVGIPESALTSCGWTDIRKFFHCDASPVPKT